MKLYSSTRYPFGFCISFLFVFQMGLEFEIFGLCSGISNDEIGLEPDLSLID